MVNCKNEDTPLLQLLVSYVTASSWGNYQEQKYQYILSPDMLLCFYIKNTKVKKWVFPLRKRMTWLCGF